MKNKQQPRLIILAALAIAVSLAVSIPTVYADTNGTELKTTAQPDRLELQFGSDWAGAEFELKLDSGVFPVPVVVNDAGVLSMDLGGSKNYTLKLLTSPAPANNPPESTPDTQETTSHPPETISEQPEPTPGGKTEPKVENEGIPPLHLILFIGGLLAAIGVLVFLYVMKKRREYSDDDDDYEYEDGEE